jgi:GTP-binding protein
MKITSAQFVKSIQGTDHLLENGIPQVAFIGRSNVGKSSVINSVTGVKDLAITSSFPGRTTALNLFLINNSVYLVDLPGYGFARASQKGRERLHELIQWYLFDAPYVQKRVVLIIDAVVGPTQDDIDMLQVLVEAGKHIVVLANKVDKLTRGELVAGIARIRQVAGDIPVIPYSSVDGIGIKELTAQILDK